MVSTIVIYYNIFGTKVHVCSAHAVQNGNGCLRLADPHLIFDRIGVRTIRTQMCCLLPEELALALKQVLSFCPTPLLRGWTS